MATLARFRESQGKRWGTPLEGVIACFATFAVLGVGTDVGLADEPLRAAIVQHDVTPPIGVPLAGFGQGGRRLLFPDVLGLHKYAFYLKPSEGLKDEIYAKVLVLTQGSKQIAFVALDLVGVSWQLRDAILARLTEGGFGPDNFFVSATHTHSGPGAMTSNAFAEMLATDRFEPEVHDAFVSGVAGAVDAAVDGLHEDVTLYRLAFDASAAIKSRRNRPVDGTANLLFVVNSDDKYLGAVVNLAIHGTIFDDKNLKYSGDAAAAIAGSVSGRLQLQNGDARPVPVLFLNGAEGDVGPVRVGEEGMTWLAEKFEELFTIAAPDLAPPNLTKVEAESSKPLWEIRRAEIDLKAPVHYLGPWGGDPGSPRVGVSLGSWASGQGARIWALRLGRMALMTWPGEPTAGIGLRLRGLCGAGESGASQAWVLGLTNDHLGYFTLPHEFVQGKYESKNSAFGPFGGVKLVKEHCQLLQQLF